MPFSPPKQRPSYFCCWNTAATPLAAGEVLLWTYPERYYVFSMWFQRGRKVHVPTPRKLQAQICVDRPLVTGEVALCCFSAFRISAGLFVFDSEAAGGVDKVAVRVDILQDALLLSDEELLVRWTNCFVLFWQKEAVLWHQMECHENNGDLWPCVRLASSPASRQNRSLLPPPDWLLVQFLRAEPQASAGMICRDLPRWCLTQGAVTQHGGGFRRVNASDRFEGFKSSVMSWNDCSTVLL